MSQDFRFNILFDSLKKFDALKDDMRRVQNFLVAAIERAWRATGRTDIRQYYSTVVSLPIGDPVRKLQVRVKLERVYARIDDKWNFRMYLIDSSGIELGMGSITLDALETVMSNPSPMIDAAAQFCDKLGCIEMFKMNVGRFYPHMEYHI